MVLNFLGVMNKLNDLTRETGTPNGETQQLGQIDEYTTFIDKCHHTKVNPPSGFKKIRVHLVFDVKHNGRHKARLVADGHLTDIPLDSVNAGVMSLQGF
jgi:hypothetical protein